MKRSKKVIDYRKKYKEFYNIDFGNDFVIHHIDGNRNNNEIDNLLLLPRKLHQQYHFYKNIVCSCNIPIQIGLRNYYLTSFKRFFEIMEECNMWYNYKIELDIQLKIGTLALKFTQGGENVNI